MLPESRELLFINRWVGMGVIICLLDIIYTRRYREYFFLNDLDI